VFLVRRSALSFPVMVERASRVPVDLDTGDGYCLTNNSKDALNREYSYPSIVEGPDGAAAHRLHLLSPGDQICAAFGRGYS
jgi:hypothetical protein